MLYGWRSQQCRSLSWSEISWSQWHWAKLAINSQRVSVDQRLRREEISIFSIENNFHRVRKKLCLCPYCSKEPIKWNRWFKSILWNITYLRVGCAVGPFLYLGNLEVDNRTQEKKTFVTNRQEFKLQHIEITKTLWCVFDTKIWERPQEDGVEMNTLAGFCTGEVAEMKTNISSRESKNDTFRFIL